MRNVEKKVLVLGLISVLLIRLALIIAKATKESAEDLASNGLYGSSVISETEETITRVWRTWAK